MKHFILFTLSCFILLSVFCRGEQLSAETVGDITAPGGYTKVSCDIFSYSSWLRGLHLKKGNIILRHDGKTIPVYNYNVFAVIDMPLLFSENIEQCADWGFRFWSEYHKDKGMLNRLYLFDYSGTMKYYNKSGKSFNSFLKYSMNYSNSHSIKSGCDKISPDDIRGGDMLVQNKTGGIGHVSIVMDVCRNSTGDELYLIGYSFMPAQQFHIYKGNCDKHQRILKILAGVYGS